MISEPTVTVTCDRCKIYTDEFGLTSLAMRGAYDERNLPREMEKAGWRTEDGKHTCPDCQAEEE